MEAEVQEKPRVSYSQFVAQQPKQTLSFVIQRVIDDVLANPDMKQIGRTKIGRLQMIQRAVIGSKLAAKLRRDDYNEHIKGRRRDDGISGATATHDLVCISTSLAHYAATWMDLDLKEAIGELDMSKLFLRKQDIISGSEPRTRLPEEEELRLILEMAHAYDQRPKAKVRCYHDFYLAGHKSGRRRGETARMKYGDFGEEIYWVRNMKHPTKKEGNDKPFYLPPELLEIVKRQPRVDANNPDEYVFKRIDGKQISGNTMGATYCEIKNKLRPLHPGLFIDLRQHDNRADRLTKLLDSGLTFADVKTTYSGHELTSNSLEKSYDRRKQEQKMRPGIEKIKAMRAAAQPVAT